MLSLIYILSQVLCICKQYVYAHMQSKIRRPINSLQQQTKLSRACNQRTQSKHVKSQMSICTIGLDCLCNLFGPPLPLISYSKFLRLPTKYF